MLEKGLAALFLTALVGAILIQSSLSFPVEPSEPKIDQKQDEFALQAANALDDTLLNLKNGFKNLIEDSNKLGSLFSHLTDSLKKLVPEADDDEAMQKTQARMEQLSANNSKIMEKLQRDSSE